MSLLEEIKKLRELEQKATPKWILSNPLKGEYQIYSEFGDLNIEFEDSDIDDPRFIVVSRNLAPAMLEVLGCFQKGDEDLLVEYIYQFTEEYGVDGVVFSDTAFGKFMKRMQKAASLMEQEEREA